MKNSDADTVVKILNLRLPTKSTLVEFEDGDRLEVRSFFIGRDFGDDVDNLYLNWGEDDFNFCSSRDIWKIVDNETGELVFEPDVDAIDKTDVKINK